MQTINRLQTTIKVIEALNRLCDAVDKILQIPSPDVANVDDIMREASTDPTHRGVYAAYRYFIDALEHPDNYEQNYSRIVDIQLDANYREIICRMMLIMQRHINIRRVEKPILDAIGLDDAKISTLADGTLPISFHILDSNLRKLRDDSPEYHTIYLMYTIFLEAVTNPQVMDPNSTFLKARFNTCPGYENAMTAMCICLDKLKAMRNQ